MISEIEIVHEAIRKILENKSQKRLNFIRMYSNKGSNIPEIESREVLQQSIFVECIVDAMQLLSNLLEDELEVIVLQIRKADIPMLIEKSGWFKVNYAQINSSLLILIEDYLGIEKLLENKLILNLSQSLGVLFSVHPRYPSLCLVDAKLRFHEFSGAISEYVEISRSQQLVDDNHKDVNYFQMDFDFVKHISSVEHPLNEAIYDMNNFLEIYSNESQIDRLKFRVCQNATGVFFRRPILPGNSLEIFLKTASSDEAVMRIINTCVDFSKLQHFPNDLRPWNMIFDDFRCLFIDFPANIWCDDDVDGFSNFIALLITLEYIRLRSHEDFYSVSSKVVFTICDHAGIYRHNAFQQLKCAWLTLENWKSKLILFSKGKISIQDVLDEVFHGD